MKKYTPTIVSDILDVDYKAFEIGYFDIIWASPECKIFSHLQYTNIGSKWPTKQALLDEQQKHSVSINRTIEIIDYLKPKYYFIENPRYSRIWDYIDNARYTTPFVLVDYCAFGYNYKKPTKILSNKKLDNALCSCIGKPKHTLRLGMLKQKTTLIDDNTTLAQRYSIPQGLLSYLFD